MESFHWILIAIAGAILIGFCIYKIVKFCKMTPEEKQEIVKQWLVAAIVAAENAIKEHGAGQEKLQMVIDKFNDKAPMLCKIILKFTNTKTLKDLIDEALNTVKDAFEKKQ